MPKKKQPARDTHQAEGRKVVPLSRSCDLEPLAIEMPETETLVATLRLIGVAVAMLNMTPSSLMSKLAGKCPSEQRALLSGLDAAVQNTDFINAVAEVAAARLRSALIHVSADG